MPKYQRVKPRYSPTNNPWKIPDWRKKSNYPNPKEMSRHLWRWEFLRRREEYRKDWETYAQETREQPTGAKDKKATSALPLSDLELRVEMPGSQEKYRLAMLLHPGNPSPQFSDADFLVNDGLPVYFKWGQAPRRESTGEMVMIPVPEYYITEAGLQKRWGEEECDVADLMDPHWDISVMEDCWGLQYILFPHEVVLYFDLRTTEVEQLCAQVVSMFPPPEGTDSSGQTVPDLGWKEFRGIPKWTGPVNAPRLILDPRVPGIVHVIFDRTQPKLEQWKSAKKWLRKMQVERVGKVKAKRTSSTASTTWLKYLRILDAYDFNPDPGNLKVTQTTIGEYVPGITNDADIAPALISQDHAQAQQFLLHFPY